MAQDIEKTKQQLIDELQELREEFNQKSLSEKKNTSQLSKLKSKDFNFRKIIENMIDGYLRATAIINKENETYDFKITEVNKILANTLKLKKTEIKKHTIKTLFPEISDEIINAFKLSINKNRDVKLNLNLTSVDKKYNTVISYLQNNEICLIFSDVTELINKEKQLEVHKERYSIVVDARKIGVWEIYPETKKFNCNTNLQKMLGFTKNGVSNDFNQWIDLVHKSERNKLSNAIKNIAKNEIIFFADEYRFKCANGKDNWFWTNGKAVREAPNETLRIVGTITDISKQKDTEKKLRKQYAMEKLISKISNGFINFPSGQFYTTVNNALEEVGKYAKVDGTCLCLVSRQDKIVSSVFYWDKRYNHSDTHKYIGLSLKHFEWLYSKLDNGEFISLQNISSSMEAVQEKKLWVSLSIASVLVLPLTINNVLIGFLSFDTKKRKKKWTDENLYLIKLLANVLGHTVNKEQTEDALRKSESKFKSIFDYSNDAISIVDYDGNFIEVNKMYCELVGFSFEQLLNKQQVSIDVLKHRKLVKAKIIELLQSKKKILETEFINSDGIYILVEISGTIINYENKKVVLSIIRDITERKKAEKRIYENLKNQKFVTELSYLFLNIKNFDTTINFALNLIGKRIKVNRIYIFQDFDNRKRTRNLYEWCGKEIIPNISDLQNVEYGVSIASWKDYLFKQKKICTNNIIELPFDMYDFLVRRQTKSILVLPIYVGSKMFGFIGFDQCSYPKKWAYEEIEFLKTITNIISNGFERMLVNREVKENEEKFRNIFNNMNDAIHITDLQGNIIDINEMAYKRLGYEKEELLTKKHDDIILDESNINSPDDIYQKIIEFGHLLYEVKQITKDGDLVPIEINSHRINFNNKEAILSIHRDISERKKVEEALFEREELFSKLISAFPDAIILTDTQGNITYATSKTIELFGYDFVNEVIGKNFLHLIVQREHEKALTNMQRVLNESIKTNDQYTLIKKDNSFFYGEINTAVTIDTKGNPKGMIAITRDITERKQMEQTILSTIINTQESERKRFAEDLHDGVGPLLSSIKMYVNMLKNQSIKEKEKMTMIQYASELIDDAISDARTIANNIMPNTLRDFGLTSSIKTFCKKINYTKTLDITFSHNFDERLNDKFEIIIYRTVTELINNTFKHANASKINIDLLKKGDILSLYYKDNGKGFDIDQIMKDPERGMGLNNITSKINSIAGTCKFSNDNGTVVKIEVSLPSELGIALNQNEHI